MRREAPDTAFFRELREVNREFLDLVRHPAADERGWRMLGLEVGVAAGIRRLSQEELSFAAGVPGLLAEFASPPGRPAVADAPRPSMAPEWLNAAQIFAAALLTYLWQVARRDPLATALCLGLGERRRQELAAIRFGDIPGSAALAAGQLRARFGSHPRLWPELLRAARSQDRRLRDLCRLDLISIGLSVEAPADDVSRARQPRL